MDRSKIGNRGVIGESGKTILAHRLSYEIHTGKRILHKLFHVTHSCFNSACVNSDHIGIGVNADNMRDWDRTGERHKESEVPDDIVSDIVKRYLTGGSKQVDLLKELRDAGYTVTRQTL